MFESSVVESAVGKHETRRILMLPVSIAVHLLAIAGFVMATAWHVAMPLQSPSQMKAFMVTQVPVVPAQQQVQRPPATAQHPASTQQVVHLPPPPGPVAPNFISDHIPTITTTAGEPNYGPVDPTYTGPYDWNAGPDSGPPSETIGDQPLPAGINDVKAPVIVQRATPEYPELARRMHLQGKVVVECIIDRQGNLTNITVAQSDHEIFNASAVEAVKKWRFLPGTLRGNPVATIFRLSVTFSLR